MNRFSFVLKFFFLFFLGLSVASGKIISLATTTSTENSGLLKFILPIFEKKHGIKIRTIVQGTGQALETGRRGDVDILMVHAPPLEKKFIADGFGVARYPFMFNDFIIIGPISFSKDKNNFKSAKDAFKTIYYQDLIFLSRGDNSGTHFKERQIWDAVNLVPKRNFSWYLSTGSGMGATINTTVAKNGYTLTDRATWLSFKNKNSHKIIVENDPLLFNQYSLIPISKNLHPHVRDKLSGIFINWLISKEGQKIISDFRINNEQLFFPNYEKAIINP
ncbi:MAG: sulfate transporter [Proteobacteria bacterium]|nr:sulfate transporter [Pseudomonadota bacterium]